MNKFHKASLLLAMNSILFTPIGPFATEQKQDAAVIVSELPTIIHHNVLETLNHSKDIPGLQSEEFSALKDEIASTWKKLSRDGVIEIRGTDKDVRPCFVALQGIVENVLSTQLKKNIKKLKGIIHTPMPATPLCTKGEISKELVDASIALDPARLLTVKARTTIVRDYLFKGGDLYIVYPKTGYDKRTEIQKNVYKQELLNYPDHLFDLPLNCESIPKELIGAIYIFQDDLGNSFVFSIKMTQANDPQDIGNFGLWFGSMDHPAVQKRLQEVSCYLESQGVDLLAH